MTSLNATIETLTNKLPKLIPFFQMCSSLTNQWWKQGTVKIIAYSVGVQGDEYKYLTLKNELISRIFSDKMKRSTLS
jgi:hypothetical protein